MRCPKDSNIVKLEEMTEAQRKENKVSILVIGIGVHPWDTPICPAAIVDNAVPIYGGVINLSIGPGQRS